VLPADGHVAGRVLLPLGWLLLLRGELAASQRLLLPTGLALLR
jgi:hypothetical protein